MSRSWIKVYCEKWCEGSIRKESPLLRAAWIDLLAFVGWGKYSDAGELKIAGEVGFTDKQISQMLVMPEADWAIQKARLIETTRIELFGENCIRIVAWAKYQALFWRANKEKYGKISKSLIQNENGLISTEKEIRDRDREEIEIEKEGRVRRRRSASRSPSGINFNYEKRAWEGVSPEQEAFWAKVYSGVNIKDELLRMAAWLDSNRDKAPVSRFGAFINRWLKGEQNKASSKRIQGPWDNRPAWMKKAQGKKGEHE